MKLDKTFFAKRVRELGLLLCDAVIVIVCTYAALLARYAPSIDKEALDSVVSFLPRILVSYLGVNIIFRMYHILWRYSDAMQLLRQAMAVVVGFGVSFVWDMLLGANPRRYFLFIVCIFTLVGICGFRVCLRLIKNYYLHHHEGDIEKSMRRIMVVGAGDAGSHVVEIFSKSAGMGTIEVIVDDDPMKQGLLIQSIPVAGSTKDIERLVAAEGITDIIIAMPTVSKERVREITELCMETDCYVRVFSRFEKAEEEESENEQETAQ